MNKSTTPLILVDWSSKLVVHRRDPHDVYVGRPSKWGNPFSHLHGVRGTVKVSSRVEAVRRYKEWITEGDGRHLLADLHELQGKVLGCWCAPMPCHARVLAELANADTCGRCRHPKGWHRHGVGSCLECGCLDYEARESTTHI